MRDEAGPIGDIEKKIMRKLGTWHMTHDMTTVTRICVHVRNTVALSILMPPLRIVLFRKTSSSEAVK